MGVRSAPEPAASSTPESGHRERPLSGAAPLSVHDPLRTLDPSAKLVSPRPLQPNAQSILGCGHQAKSGSMQATVNSVNILGAQIDSRALGFFCAFTLGFIFIRGIIKGKILGLGYTKTYARKDSPIMYWFTVGFHGVVVLGLLGVLLFGHP